MLEQLFQSVFKADFLFAVLRITAPILFATLGAVVAEKAGVVNIGLEGIMMITALFGFLFAYWTQSWLVGVLGAVVVGILLGLMMGFFSLKLKTDIILAGIAVVTVLDIGRDLITGDPASPIWNLKLGAPDLSAIGQADVRGALSLQLLPLLLGLIVVDFFDTLGTMTAIGEQAGLTDEKGQVENGTRVLAVDAMGAVIGGLCGASSVTSYVESASGVGDGGRTGLMPIVTGVLFLASIVLAPLFGLVPAEATAPALIFVGFLMLRGLRSMEWNDVTIAVPAFVTLIAMPLTYSISHGIGYGFISYVLIGIMAGRWRQIHPMMYVVAALFALSFVFVLE